MTFNFKPFDKRAVEFGNNKFPLNLYGDKASSGLITDVEIGKCIAQVKYVPIPDDVIGDSLSEAMADAAKPLRDLLVMMTTGGVLRRQTELSIRLAIGHYCNGDKLRALLDNDCARISALTIDEDKDPELSLIRKDAIIDFVLLRHSKQDDYVHSPVSFTPSPNAVLIFRLIETIVLLQNVGFIRTEEELQAAAANKEADVTALYDRAIAQLIILDSFK